MRKSLSGFIILIIALILPLFLPTPITNADALNVGSEAKVIVSRCYLYAENSFSSEKVVYIEEENTITVSFKHGDTVNVQSINGDFAYVTTDNQHVGYIYKYYLTDNVSQAVYPVYNASVRRTTAIYDIEKTKTDLSLKKGTRIYLYEGFNKKGDLTAAQFTLEDGSLYNGYINTADIKPDGISGLLIAGITIILAVVTIVLSLVFIKKKKKKKTD